MKTKPILTTCLLTLCSFAAVLHAQTPPLTPSGPPSDPATAMKSLNQVEPRTAIGTAPFTITESGSYYLVKNLSVPYSSTAITIDAENVTLDLSGFTISSAAGSGSAQPCITATNSARCVTVRNGTIQGGIVSSANAPYTFSGSGFSVGVALPVSDSVARSHRVEHMTVRGTTDGINCGGIGNSPPSVLVSHCQVQDVPHYGIAAGNGTVTDCTAQRFDNYGYGIKGGVVTRCAASDGGNTTIAILGDVVTECRASSSSGTGGAKCIQGASITNCRADVLANGQTGIDGTTVTGCTVQMADRSSITAITGRSATNCHVTAYGGVMFDVEIANGCTFYTVGGATNNITHKYNMP